MTKSIRFIAIAAAAALLLTAIPADAQTSTGRVWRGQSRFTVFGDVIMSQPKGDFANYVDRGFGINGGGMFHLDRDGMFSIRADLGGLQYGRERKRIPLLPLTGRLTVDVITENTIAWGGIGPQFTFPSGPVRPYANAAIAFSNLRTTSALEDRETSERFATTDNASDWTSAYIFGGGVYIPFGGRASAAMLTLGGRYFYGGEATYLPEGGITDNPDGTVTLSPQRTETDFVVWQVGVTFRIPNPTARR